jgi:hypothetical protein
VSDRAGGPMVRPGGAVTSKHYCRSPAYPDESNRGTERTGTEVIWTDAAAAVFRRPDDADALQTFEPLREDIRANAGRPDRRSEKRRPRTPARA